MICYIHTVSALKLFLVKLLLQIGKNHKRSAFFINEQKISSLRMTSFCVIGS